jgi:hypothetical protein
LVNVLPKGRSFNAEYWTDNILMALIPFLSTTGRRKWILPAHNVRLHQAGAQQELEWVSQNNGNDKVFDAGLASADGLNWAQKSTHPCMHGSSLWIMYEMLFSVLFIRREKSTSVTKRS